MNYSKSKNTQGFPLKGHDIILFILIHLGSEIKIRPVLTSFTVKLFTI